jgi:hypothetical protein
MRFFLSFIRERYRIHTAELNPLVIDQLHLRSGISKEHLVLIMNEYERLSMYVQLDDAAALSFYKLLSYFFNNCKK